MAKRAADDELASREALKSGERPVAGTMMLTAE